MQGPVGRWVWGYMYPGGVGLEGLQPHDGANADSTGCANGWHRHHVLRCEAALSTPMRCSSAVIFAALSCASCCNIGVDITEPYTDGWRCLTLALSKMRNQALRD